MAMRHGQGTMRMRWGNRKCAKAGTKYRKLAAKRDLAAERQRVAAEALD